MSTDGPPIRGSGVEGLRLDELFEELQVRIEKVRGTWDRLNGLLDAVMSVGRELDLPQVLQGIVEAAVVLVDSEYGALGVIGDGQKLAQFLPVGISDELRARIGELPAGHGLLGELIRHPEPLRLSELSEHPAAAGFPDHHPMMRSFLGVPVRVREEVFGNLYLTEKRGGAQFGPEDEAVVSTLAVAAGIAIENARLFEEVRLRERWGAAGSGITSALLSGTAPDEVLAGMLERAHGIVGADIGVLYLIGPSGDVRGSFAHGDRAEEHSGMVLPTTRGTLADAALTRDGLFSTADLERDERLTSEPASWRGFGPAVAVSIGTQEKLSAVLVLARYHGRPAFSPSEVGSLPGYADQAALALELAERRRDAEQLSLLEDRDRIARDLHDLAIQRIFATGMTLQSAQRLVDHPEASERLARAVDDLDATIKIIRSTIFGLRSHDEPGTPQKLRLRAVHVVDSAAAGLGFSAALRLEGLLDTGVPPDVADDALAVIGEALMNVARHAHATHAEVCLVAAGGALAVTVSDDGIGLPDGGRRSGLRNLAERAERHGGTLTFSTNGNRGRGTRLEWRVHLPPPPA
ncbi:GAF domain-containing protein [Streptomyces sp. NPDC051546]|uniref:sensor histidine kinase n=1 Tax=Streptomyces sp. NPDC051546 TaxID=3365655 RepID=UPI0037A220C7